MVFRLHCTRPIYTALTISNISRRWFRGTSCYNEGIRQIQDTGQIPFLKVTFCFILAEQSGYELSNGPKELYVMEGAGHFDFYDNLVYIQKAVDKLAEFL